jgi:transcriptional regulator with XRE-family HTH domain
MLETANLIEPVSNHAAQSIALPHEMPAVPEPAPVDPTPIEQAAAPAKRNPVRKRVARRNFIRRANSSHSRKALGSVIRARRLELMMTQRDLALQLGVKPAHVAYLELDRRRPSLNLLSRITDVLDLDRERLILLSHPEARIFLGPRAIKEKRPLKDQAWRDFKRNRSLLARNRVTKKEMRILSQVALLGRIASPRSFLFILNSIRQAVEGE